MDEKVAALLELWAAGKLAPYALFEGDVLIGGPRLVEQIADDRSPVIQAGQEITPELAARVARQINPPPGESVEVEVLVRDENGDPTFDGDDNPITETATVTPLASEAVLLSLVGSTEPATDHCDMCGTERDPDRLKRIGSGRYCYIDTRVPIGGTDPVTCFDLRMEQMA